MMSYLANSMWPTFKRSRVLLYPTARTPWLGKSGPERCARLISSDAKPSPTPAAFASTRGTFAALLVGAAGCGSLVYFSAQQEFKESAKTHETELSRLNRRLDEMFGFAERSTRNTYMIDEMRYRLASSESVDEIKTSILKEIDTLKISIENLNQKVDTEIKESELRRARAREKRRSQAEIDGKLIATS